MAPHTKNGTPHKKASVTVQSFGFLNGAAKLSPVVVSKLLTLDKKNNYRQGLLNPGPPSGIISSKFFTLGLVMANWGSTISAGEETLGLVYISVVCSPTTVPLP